MSNTERHCYINKEYNINSQNKYDNYLNRAAFIARKSTMTQKHGCIIVYKNKIVSEAYNTMPLAHSDSLHAEVSAINKIKHNPKVLKNSLLFIVRIGPESLEHPLKYSKPCLHCENYISQHRIRKAFYSTNYERDICTNVKVM
jgi:deoxycytidylate deaminase